MKPGTYTAVGERRIKNRHKAPCLEVTLSQKGWFRRLRQPIKVKTLDFNRYGMAIETPVRFRTKERIYLEFRGKYIFESGICGLVSSITEEDGVYRLGITFRYCTCSRFYSREVDNALSRIESIYNKDYFRSPLNLFQGAT